MKKLNLQSLNDRDFWQQTGIALPRYDIPAMAARTRQNPVWVHFGAGNIFRGFIAVLQQRLLNEGLADRGIIAVDTFDYDIIDRIYTPFDNLTLNVILKPDATIDCEVIASVAEGLRGDSGDTHAFARLRAVFADPGLQMASLTITEKGYALRGADGAYLPAARQDMENGPDRPRHAMGIFCALLLHRYRNGAPPIAVVSMDNCSHNGEKLQESVLEMARAWKTEPGFLDYLSDENAVSFPWSMIDKITPRPDAAVEKLLAEKGVGDMAPIVTGKNTFIAPFVNAEGPQYLVIEDRFPNGRPPLEQAGVYLTDRDTVNKTERMKVTTCLNPLHTAMSVYGCLLGYTRIWQEMEDEEIVALIRRLGYTEGLPVVTDPGILSPQAFIDEVMTQRLPNPFMPDAPQRIATDTSQKVGIRFGETIKSYLAQGRDLDQLVAIPLALAGWMRYLLGVDDAGNAMEVSADPLREDLQKALSTVVWNQPDSYRGQLEAILSNPVLFGLDLTATPLGPRIEGYFRQLLAGPGAVRETLRTHLN